MRVGGPGAPSPPSPGRLSCTRTLYPVFGLRFINVTFSLGSTGRMAQHPLFSPNHSRSCHLPSDPLYLPSSSRPPIPPSPSPYSPVLSLALSPLTHNGGPVFGAILGPVVQANRGDGAIPGERDQRGDHKLATLLGQEPRSSQGHWRLCQRLRVSKAWLKKPALSKDNSESLGKYERNQFKR